MLAAGYPVGDVAVGGDFARTRHLMMVIGADIVVTVVVDAALLVVLDMPVGIVFDMRGKVFLAVDINFLAAFRILKTQLIEAFALVGLGFKRGAGFGCR
ncbi:hypothetical protein Xbed_03789 [Xenorhabdus beddingii]|uniref:Uncharacterized protein n=1 Tax=Xenorhabdus beddingii TaxID=40578 RepID=A0A1Y2S5N7_9GAMM|nr:hypothetical protein Xbed_03789 [Xenorhabdus beddingii]